MKKGKEDKAEEILSEKNEERKRAIDAAMGQIEKQFGKGYSRYLNRLIGFGYCLRNRRFAGW